MVREQLDIPFLTTRNLVQPIISSGFEAETTMNFHQPSKEALIH
jgi:hypothetical protein